MRDSHDLLVLAIRKTDDPELSYHWVRYLTHLAFIAMGLRN